MSSDKKKLTMLRLELTRLYRMNRRKADFKFLYKYLEDDL